MTRSKRIYVLDTNVLMHDPTALFKFEEHDVFIPMMVLEELDNAKKGHSEASRNARQVSRFLNELIEAHGSNNVDGGIALAPAQGPAAARRQQRRQAAVPAQADRDRQALRHRDAGQPDPGLDPAAARGQPGHAGGAGVEGHQPAHQGLDLRRRRRGLRERPRDRRFQPAVHRRDGTAGRLLGTPRGQPAFVDRKGPHLLRSAAHARTTTGIRTSSCTCRATTKSS